MCLGTVLRESLTQEIRAGDKDGIFVMVDAGHACRKNSYHTEHIALTLPNSFKRSWVLHKSMKPFGCDGIIVLIHR